MPPIGAADEFAELGEHISMTERRAAAAERGAMDRYTAAFLAERVGATFGARVNGVTRAGLFVTLDDTGADGLVPISMIGGDFFMYLTKNAIKLWSAGALTKPVYARRRHDGHAGRGRMLPRAASLLYPA